MRRIKYGRLYWLQLEADDIDKFLLVRIFRKLGILYIPWTLRRYHELYLREDRSKYSRRLINYCRKWGIVTYVVQEGPIYYPHQAKWSHLPLYADMFLCPSADHEMWVKEGMPKDRIKTYPMQKKKEDYRDVAFLEPFVTWAESQDLRSNLRNARILKIVYDLLEKNVVFSLDRSHADLIRPFLPPHRIVDGVMSNLVDRYENIYCFSGSPVVQECKKAGKSCIIVDQEDPLPPIAAPRVDGTKNADKNAVALLGAFVVWDDLGFTWRKDLYNVRIFKSLAEVGDERVLFKPHQARAELILPFLPPERVTWESAESLIKRHDTIYLFWDSSVRMDCEMLDKPYRLIGAPDANLNPWKVS